MNFKKLNKQDMVTIITSEKNEYQNQIAEVHNISESAIILRLVLEDEVKEIILIN